jgi:hypothetical protein
MKINKVPTRDYTNYHVDIAKLSSAKAKPASMTTDDLLKLRTQRDFERNKATMLSAHSITEDLYSSASSSGLSIISEEMHIINPVTDDTSEYKFTDSQFINNFVVKESFYQDQIKSNFSGEELTTKLDELKTISDKVINDLAEKFACDIGSFFNGTLSWLNDGKPSAANGASAQPEFQVSTFKSHILDIVEQSRKALADIKKQEPDKWADMLRSGGSVSSHFSQELDASVRKLDSGNSSRIEWMGYSDINAVSGAIWAMGKGIYTNSSAILAAYLGQEKLKSVIIAEHFTMSENVKQKFLATVDQNIQHKIESYKATWTKGMNSPDKVQAFDTMYESFSNLSGTDTKEFRSQYANNLKSLYDTLATPSPSPETPRANQLRMARDTVEMLSHGWSSFLETMGMSQSDFSVSGMFGNLVDAVL